METVKSIFILQDNMSEPLAKIDKALDTHTQKSKKTSQSMDNLAKSMHAFSKNNDMPKNIEKTAGSLEVYTQKSKTAEQSTSKLTTTMLKLAPVIVGAFAVSKIKAFASESVDLAMKAEGIRTAFERLDDGFLLNNLRSAVKHTVSDLELMQKTVMADKLGIDVQSLADLFRFADKTAQETGQSVDHLVESITLGIGRKSTMILDNLGISAIQLNEKLKGVSIGAASVGDVARAVGEIASEGMASMGDIAETAQVKFYQMQAAAENLKVEIGNLLLPAQMAYNQILRDALFTWTEIARLAREATFDRGKIKEEERLTKEKEKQRLAQLDELRITRESIELTEQYAKARGKTDGSEENAKLQEMVLNWRNAKLLTESELKTAKERLKVLSDTVGLGRLRKSAKVDGPSAEDMAKVEDFIKKSEISLKDGSEREKAIVNEKYKSMIGMAKNHEELTRQLRQLQSREIQKIDQKELRLKSDVMQKEQEEIRNFIQASNIDRMTGSAREIAQTEEKYKKILELEGLSASQRKEIVDGLAYDKLAIEERYINETQQKIKDFINSNIINLKTGQDKELALIEEKYKKILDMEELTGEQRKQIISQKNSEISKALESDNSITLSNYEDQWRTTYNNVVDIVGQSASMINSIAENGINRQIALLDKKSKKEYDEIQKSSRSEKEKAKLLETLDSQVARKRHELAMKDWRSSLIMSIVNTALSISKTATMGFPQAIPFMVAAGAIGAVQTGLIASNKPEFQKGGVFDGLGVVPGTSYTGDNVNAKLNSGEGVINNFQAGNIMKQLFRVANGANVNYMGDETTTNNSTNNNPTNNNSTNNNNNSQQILLNIGSPVYQVSGDVSQDTVQKLAVLTDNFQDKVIKSIENAITNKQLVLNYSNPSAREPLPVFLPGRSA